jgi:hypothetical protein
MIQFITDKTKNMTSIRRVDDNAFKIADFMERFANIIQEKRIETPPYEIFVKEQSFFEVVKALVSYNIHF